METELAKRNAANRAVDIVLEGGYRLVGVGTGSTVEKFVEELSKRLEAREGVLFVPSSISTALLLRQGGFRVLDVSTVDFVEIYVDGADEVSEDGSMIKGGGAAMTLEKILAYSSLFNVFIVDYTKKVERLGERHPLPVEVVPQALNLVLHKLKSMGLEAGVRVSGRGKYGPVVSDLGGVIVDVRVPENADLNELSETIESIPGVVSTGFFKGFTDLLIVGYSDRVEELRFTRKKGVHLAE